MLTKYEHGRLQLMKQFRKDAWEMIKENWPSLLAFETAYRIFTAFLRAVGGEWLTGRLLEEQGYSYLTTDNLKQFLSHPHTVLVAVLTVLAALFIMLAEVCGLLACFERSWKKEKIAVTEMFAAGLKESLSFFRRYPLSGILYIAGCIPYLSFQEALWGYLTGGLPLLPALILALAAAGALTGSVLLSLKLPFRIMRPDLKKREAGKIRVKNMAQALLLQAAVTAAAGLLYLTAMFLMTAGVALAGDPDNPIGAVMVFGSRIRAAIRGIAGALGTVTGVLHLFLIFAGAEKSTPVRKPPALMKRVAGGKRRWADRAVVLLLFTAEAAVISYFVRNSILYRGTAWRYVSVTAHRGGPRMAPENTVSAMKYAVSSRADYAEIDIQETKDGEIVLLHDSNLLRVAGLDADIWELTYEEVSSLDAGGRFRKAFQGEKIPTLEDVIEYCRGKIKLNIEVKNNGHNDGIIEKVVRIIEEQNFAEHCVLTSMDYEFLEQVKKINPDIATGYTMTVVYGDVSGLTAADFFSVNYVYLSREFVQQAHTLGKEVFVWTLNSPGDVQRAVDCGADNIITDDPELVRRALLGGAEDDPPFSELLIFALK